MNFTKTWLTLHACVAVYALSLGILDSFGLLQSWMMPEAYQFYYSLVFSAIIFVIVGVIFTIKGNEKRGRIILTHILLGVLQFIGTSPLVA